MITPTDYQGRVLETPEDVSCILDGGRGSGKTKGLALNAVRHCELHGERAHVLFVREHLRALAELEDEIGTLVEAAFPKSKHNRQEHVIRLPGGGTIEFAPLSCADDYAKLQGRSFSLICCDEAGNMATSKWLFMLQSNLRAGADVPCRLMLGANPAGRLHTVIQQRFLSKAPPWTIFEIDGVKWIRCPGTWLDNRANLPSDYPKRLLAATGKDRALAQAWLEGRWDIAKGAYFAGVLDETRQMLDSRNLDFDPRADTVLQFIAGDYGQSSPTVAGAFCKLLAPQGRFPRNSIIQVGEWTTCDPSDLSIGIPHAPGQIADALKAMADRCFGPGRGRRGVFDNSKGLNGDSLLGFFASQGLPLTLPKKSRIEGWALLREHFLNSYEANGRPGYWASSDCGIFWSTVPCVPRCDRNPEDVDTRANDHSADMARYSVVANVWCPPLKKFPREAPAHLWAPRTLDNMSGEEALRYFNK